MKARPVLQLFTTLLLPTVTFAQQLSLKFDMGTPTSPEATSLGYERVTSSTAYGNATLSGGAGWDMPSPTLTDHDITFGTPVIPIDVQHNLPEDLLRDYVHGNPSVGTSFSFSVDIAPTAADRRLLCVVYLGALDGPDNDPDVSHHENCHEDIRIEYSIDASRSNTKVAEGLFTRLPRFHGGLLGARGGYRRATFVVNPWPAGAQTLHLKFFDDTQANGQCPSCPDEHGFTGGDAGLTYTCRPGVPILAIEVHDYIEPPFVFTHPAAGEGPSFVLSPDLPPPVSLDGLNELNAALSSGDWEPARDYFVGRDVGQDFPSGTTPPVGTFNVRGAIETAWGLAWVAGALTNTQETVDFRPIPTSTNDWTCEDMFGQARRNILTLARRYLDAIGDASSNLPYKYALVDDLNQQLKDFERGAIFDLTRSYTPSVTSDPAGEFYNPANLAPSSTYPWGPLNADRSPMTRNLNASVLLLQQFGGDTLSTNDQVHLPQSPLFVKAQYMIVRSLYARNTQIEVGGSTPGALKYNKYWLDIIFDDLWPALNPDTSGATPSTFGVPLFPSAYEAITFTWLIQEYVERACNTFPYDNNPPCSGRRLLEEDAGIPKAWLADLATPGASPYPPGLDVNQAWWHDQAVFPDVTCSDNETCASPTPPCWAVYQREMEQQVRNVGAWWLNERLLTGPGGAAPQFGGGVFDDVEAIALFAPHTVMRESVSNPIVQATKTFVEELLTSTEAGTDLCEGYGVGLAQIDVEHAAETTADPLFFLNRVFYADPLYSELSLRNLRNLDDLHRCPGPTCSGPGPGGSFADNCAPWMKRFRVDPGPPQVIGRHFNTDDFDGGCVDFSGGRSDIPLNMRSIFAGLDAIEMQGRVIDSNGIPVLTVGQLASLEYARAWASAAMTTDLNTSQDSNAPMKPSGILPARVVTDAFGNPVNHGAYEVHDPPDPSFWNWMNSTNNPAAEGDLYRLMIRAYELTTRWPPASPTISTGDVTLLEPLWDAVQQVDGINMAGMGDTCDPSVPGSPCSSNPTDTRIYQRRTEIADAAFFAEKQLEIAFGAGVLGIVNGVIDNNASPIIRYLNQNQVTYSSASRDDLLDVMNESRLWLRHFWPMATTLVKYTDRIKLANVGTLTEMQAGGRFSGGPSGNPVTWFNADDDPDDSADVAILVNYFRPSSADAPADKKGRLDALIYNFESVDQAYGVRILRGFGGPGICLRVACWKAYGHGQFSGQESLRGRWCEIPGGGPLPPGYTTVCSDAPGRTATFTLQPGLNMVQIVAANPCLPCDCCASVTLAAKPDLAVSKRDVSLVSDQVIRIRIHNIGTADFAGGPNDVIHILRDGVAVSPDAPIMPISAPNSSPSGLDPQSVDHDFDLGSAWAPGVVLEIQVAESSGSVVELRKENNVVRLAREEVGQEVPLSAPGCP